MAYLADIHSSGNVKDIRQVMDYIHQLEDQLRYVIQHIGAENIQPDAINEEQLSPKVKQNMHSMRKTVTDLNRHVSSYRQTADETARKVRQMEEEGVEKVHNEALTIDGGGIDITGGELNVRAESAFRVKNGEFDVFTADENGCIKFGGTEQNPNASLGSGGTLRVKTIYAESIHTGSSDFFHGGQAMADSHVIVSATKPEGHGLLWVQPLAANIVDYTLIPSAVLPMDGAEPEQTLTLARVRPSALEGQTCRYGVKFSIYNASGACIWNKVQVHLMRAGQSPLLIYESSPNQQVSAGDYFCVDTLASPSAGIENLTSLQSLLLRVNLTKSNGTQSSFSVNSPVILRCVAAQGDSGDGTQPCDIRYIP